MSALSKRGQKMEGVEMPLYTSRGLQVIANIAWSIPASNSHLSLFCVFFSPKTTPTLYPATTKEL